MNISPKGGDLPLTQDQYIDCKPDGYAVAGNRKQRTEQDVLNSVAAPEEGNTP